MRSSSDLPPCVRCSGEMQGAFYMHDATRNLWSTSFCLDCGYQSESRLEKCFCETQYPDSNHATTCGDCPRDYLRNSAALANVGGAK